ncbi:unnamed protein product [Urochloa decumbens]|uniref:Uncharacterized protein n=1 Tax=Urochloa decumbens TaxID=240449 RepID=A0ABC9FX39_9POAL
MPGRLEPARINPHGAPHLVTARSHNASKSTQAHCRQALGEREEDPEQSTKQLAMEGLIPFVIDAFRRSHERSSYRSVSSDGGSSRGGGSRRHLIDYSELPDAASSVEGPSASGALHRRARSEFVQGAGVRRVEEHGRPAAVVAGSAYRRK